jgi:hypothetical protein
LFHTKEEAEARESSIIAQMQREKLKSLAKGNISFLPPRIGVEAGVYSSGNPLRFSEPNIVSAVQSNTFGKLDTSQKILQLVGAIWEDVDMLLGILFVLGYANDYVKKLIGKYIILELRSLYKCLRQLRKVDANIWVCFVN